MRKNLKKIGTQERHTFTGTFVRYGTRSGYKGMEPTLLLKEIKDKDGKIVTDHLWFALTKGFSKYELEEGDVLQFDARVSKYIKGYKGYDFIKNLECPIEEDYKLSYPTKIKLLTHKG